MNTRNELLPVGLALDIWETVDVVDTGIPAAVFAVMFFVCTAWLGATMALGTAGIAAAAAFLLRSRLRHAQARPLRVERPFSQFAKEEE